MRVLICTDLEGVAGVSTFTVDTAAEGCRYVTATRLLAEEVNAAVRGFLRAGATEIAVIDGHGPGAVDFETLQPPARLIHGRPLPPVNQLFAELAARYDVLAMVGQHAMAGVRNGNLNHTQCSTAIDYYKLNGKLIGETAQCALFFGEYGIPLVFLSGDVAACDEAEELVPGITTAAVKEGLGRSCAMTMTAAESRETIEKQAETALLKHRQKAIAPVVWAPPYTLEIRYFHTDTADSASARPGSRRIDARTIQLCSDKISDIIY